MRAATPAPHGLDRDALLASALLLAALGVDGHPVVGGLLALLAWLGWRRSRGAWSLLAVLVTIALGAGAGTLLSGDASAVVTGVLIATTLAGAAGRVRWLAWSGATLLLLFAARGATEATRAAWLLPLALVMGVDFRVAARTRSRLMRGAMMLVSLLIAAALVPPLQQAERTVTHVLGLAVERWVRPPPTALERSLRLSSFDRLELDPTPLYLVEGWSGGYLRAVVMERFDGREWSSVPSIAAPSIAAPSSAPEATVSSLSIRPIAAVDALLPLPAAARRLPEGIAWLPGQVARVEPQLEGVVRVALAAEDQLPSTLPPEEDATRLPPVLVEPLATRAARYLPRDGTTRERAADLERWFRASFGYSTEVRLDGRGSPLLTLIDNRGAATCGYFAAAMAALLRAGGIPSRVVGGYVVDAGGGAGPIVVRAWDAHAWVEAWLPEEGRWARFDPTPADGRMAALMDQQRLFLASPWAERLEVQLRLAWRELTQRGPATLRAVLLGLALLVLPWLLWRARADRRASVALTPSGFPPSARLDRARRRLDRLAARLDDESDRSAWRAAESVYQQLRFDPASTGDLSRLTQTIDTLERRRQHRGS